MGFLEERDLSDVPSITEYYRDKAVFITGGTGFMGQCLIEKLLHSCDDLGRIYVLIRNKKGKDVEERIKDLYSSPCFNRLREDKPNVFKEKVVGVAGDVGSVSLGISLEDRKLLIDNVNIIFHVAASVRFDDDLRQATTLNLKSIVALTDLAKEMGNLSALIHVSTCYTNTNYGLFIEEKLYPPHADWKETIEICDNIDINTLNCCTSKYIRGLPNTYVFTKQLAEHHVSEQRGLLPVVIIRPSVVIGSLDEPKPGWISSFNGPVGISVGGGKGIMSIMLGKADANTDYIPVDICVKHFIVAAWIRGTKKLEITDEVPIYNCSNNSLYTSPTLKQLSDFGAEMAMIVPLENAIKYPGVTITTNRTLFYILFMIFDLSRGVLIDTILRMFGKKPMLVKILRKVYKSQISLYVYLTNGWTLDNKNFILLRSCIKDEDRKKFYYDLENLDWRQCFTNIAIGAKEFLLNESIDNLPKTRKHIDRLLVARYVLRVILYGLTIWLLYKKSVNNWTNYKSETIVPLHDKLSLQNTFVH